MKGVGTSPPTEPGTLVDDKFRVESVLGEGGMGVVVRALHLRLGTPVALKFLLPDALADPVVVERFTREARAAARLTSEHVARVIDVGSSNGAPYMVMEFLEGETVAASLKRRGPLGIEEACGAMIQICDALAEAHGLGIVHRDLKPANLFLAKRSNGKTVVKVLDFGISKVGGDGSSTKVSELTMTTSLLGTPHYMSPEQIHSSRSVDARADLWSCGVCLFRMLTNGVPFDAENVVDLIKLILDANAPDVRTRRPEIPPGLAAIVARCLRADPRMRWGSASELAQALAPYMEATARPAVPFAPTAMMPSALDAPTRVEAAPAMRTQYTPSAPPPPHPSQPPPRPPAGYVMYPPPAPSGPALPIPQQAPDPRTGGQGYGRHLSAPPPPRRSRLGPLALAAFVVGLAVGGYFVVRARQARARAALASQAPEPAPAPVPVPVPVVTETAAPTPAAPPPIVTVAPTPTTTASAKLHPTGGTKRPVPPPPPVTTATAVPPPPTTNSIPDER